MSKIFDNSSEEKKFKKVLKDVISEDGIKTGDKSEVEFLLEYQREGITGGYNTLLPRDRRI